MLPQPLLGIIIKTPGCRKEIKHKKNAAQVSMFTCAAWIVTYNCKEIGFNFTSSSNQLKQEIEFGNHCTVKRLLADPHSGIDNKCMF